MKIIIDSREQAPLDFKDSKIKKLNAGDYSIEGYEDKIAIERKSAGDIFGTLGKGHKRFKKELERVKEYDYFGIYIEDSFENIYNKTFENSHFSKMHGFVIIAILNTLKIKYGIDVVFCNSRVSMKQQINEVFKAYLKVKSTPVPTI
jgi:ERCC4-type nuclease